MLWKGKLQDDWKEIKSWNETLIMVTIKLEWNKLNMRLEGFSII